MKHNGMSRVVARDVWWTTIRVVRKAVNEAVVDAPHLTLDLAVDVAVSRAVSRTMYQAVNEAVDWGLPHPALNEFLTGADQRAS